MSPAFTGFCDDLLQANRVWKQEKEIKHLKRSVEANKEAKRSAAFNNFCTELLLSNKVWKKQRELEQLKKENDKLAAETSPQAVLDAEKEQAREEELREAWRVAEESRQALAELKQQHEQEVREMVEEWRKEQRELRREVERLRAAQQARWIEQEISNELEDRLFEKAYPSMEEGEARFGHEEAQNSEYECDSDGETYLEEMSSSSTCVGSPSPSPPAKRTQFRICEAARHASRSPSPLTRKKVDASNYAGFSFNPSFFGPGKSASRPSSRAQSPSVSPSSKMLESRSSGIPVRSRRDSMPARPTPLKAAWKP